MLQRKAQSIKENGEKALAFVQFVPHRVQNNIVSVRLAFVLLLHKVQDIIVRFRTLLGGSGQYCLCTASARYSRNCKSNEKRL